jgi:hypothetical protein
MYKIYRHFLIEISELLDDYSIYLISTNKVDKLDKLKRINNKIKSLVYAHEDKPNS